jgi:hypothetical protein
VAGFAKVDAIAILDRLAPRNVERFGDETDVVRQLLSGDPIAVSGKGGISDGPKVTRAIIISNMKLRPVVRRHLSLNLPVSMPPSPDCAAQTMVRASRKWSSATPGRFPPPSV